MKVYGSSMDITLLYFDGCPNWKTADQRLVAIAADVPDLTIARRRIESPEDAERVGFHGSPSILVDGVDAFAEPGAGVGMACRVYSTPEGPAGAPTVSQLREAIGKAQPNGTR